MKILMVVEAVSPVMGGVAEGTYQQSRELTARGHEVEVMTGEPDQVERFAQIGVEHHAFAPKFKPWRWTPETSKWLEGNIDRFDVVILRGLWQHPMLAARRAAKAAGVPYILFPHGMLDPFFKSTPKQLLVKSVYWSLFEGPTVRGAERIVFTADQEERLAREAYNLGSVKGVQGYGISDPGLIEDHSFAKEHGLKPGDYLLYMSRLHSKKGLDLLIRSVGRLPDGERPTLAICGDDTDAFAAELKSLAKQEGLDNEVRFCGFTHGAAKWSAISGCSGLILPSHQENFGIVIAEAMALGRPVMTTQKVNIWREIEAGGAGLVDIDTQEGVDRLVSRFQSLSAEDRQAMGARARALFLERFEIKSAVDRLEETLSEVAA